MLRSTLPRFLLSVLAFVALADNKAVAGKWSLTATDSQGDRTAWTLVVKDEGGKLSGALTNAEGAEIALIDPTSTGAAFTFKVRINDLIYTVDTKVEGAKMTGKYSGAEATGTLTAVKQ